MNFNYDLHSCGVFLSLTLHIYIHTYIDLSHAAPISTAHPSNLLPCSTTVTPGSLTLHVKICRRTRAVNVSHRCPADEIIMEINL